MCLDGPCSQTSNNKNIVLGYANGIVMFCDIMLTALSIQSPSGVCFDWTSQLARTGQKTAKVSCRLSSAEAGVKPRYLNK